MKRISRLLSCFIAALALPAFALGPACPENRRPDAPPLAEAGPSAAGVQDFRLPAGGNGRELDLSLWYPAEGDSGEAVTYRDALGSGPNDPERPVVPFDFCGHSRMQARPATVTNPLPVVLISHGYPGSRVLMAWLAEHLASHGFAAIGIDHSGALHSDRGEFADVLINKPTDIRAVIDAIQSGTVGIDELDLNADRIGLVGYSMGGYAGLVKAGAGLHPRLTELPPLAGVDLTPLLAPKHEADPRIAALVAIAPWGGPEALERVGLNGLSLWPAEALGEINVPLLLISGDADLVSGYERGARWIFEHGRQPRWLLTYHQARHNVAPMPPPPISRDSLREFQHYAEPIWDIERLNDLNRHFVLAFFKSQLQLWPDAGDWLSPHRNGAEPPKGFTEHSAIGFSLEKRGAQQ